MDFRTYSFPPLEKDFLWDLFLMDRSPWADPNPTIDAGHALLPESQPHRSLPVMVARQRNRDRVNGRGFIGMIRPGRQPSPAHGHRQRGGDPRSLPALISAHTVPLPEPAQPVCELRDDDCWLVASYDPPPPISPTGIRSCRSCCRPRAYRES